MIFADKRVFVAATAFYFVQKPPLHILLIDINHPIHKLGTQYFPYSVLPNFLEISMQFWSFNDNLVLITFNIFQNKADFRKYQTVLFD